MTFELTILGSNAAVPANGRHPSAQYLDVGREAFLIDCGEGTQIQMMNFRIKRSKINHIFISHLHGDHIFGLIGLLMSMSLNNRKTPLHVYSPNGLEDIIRIQIDKPLTYPLHFHVTNPETPELLYESNTITVRTIPLVHRVPCHGFLFEEKDRPAQMRKEKIEEYAIPYTAIPAIKKGGDYMMEDGRCIPNSELTKPAPKGRKFAYCSDTMYSEKIVPLIKEVDILYHEATFMHDCLEQAEKTMHTTALQAATIAQKARVRKLIVGHFSSRYKNLVPLLEEAQSIFEATQLAEEGALVRIS